MSSVSSPSRGQDPSAPTQHAPLPWRTLLEAFSAQVRRAPEAIALEEGSVDQATVNWADLEQRAVGEDDGQVLRLTYDQLNRAAAAVAEDIAGELSTTAASAALGVEPVVALCLPRGVELVTAMLGSLAAGAAYVALDPTHPPRRNRQLVADSGAAILVARSEVARELGFAGTVIPREQVSAAVERALERAGEGSEGMELGAEDLRLDQRATAPTSTDALAYLVYTSGSTGRPKGVSLCHRGLLRLGAASRWFQAGPGDRVGQVIASTFDVSTLEIWGALINGATLVIVPPEVVRHPQRFAAALKASRLDLLVTATALVNEVARHDPSAFSGLRSVFAGGEAPDPAVFAEVLDAGPPQVLFNAYGPTESTAISLWQPLPREQAKELVEPLRSAGSIPMGLPVEGTEALLVDARGLTAEASSGELALAGDGLARGYWRMPARTADAFRPHPGPSWPGQRIYRTGDKAQRLADGRFDFLGRLDRQVKVRGFRIELGEVEARLREHGSVGEVVVEARGRGAARRLVTWFVPAVAATEATGRPRTADLQAHLATRLPEYMVPTAFVPLDAFPLTAHGKVDRSALPDPAPREAEGRAPETLEEREIAALWARGLGLEDGAIGAQESLFGLGGNSLLTTRLASAVADRFGVALDMARLFDDPTVETWARVVASADARREDDEPELVKVEPRPENPPPSLAQQRTWFLQHLDPTSLAYQAQAVMHLTGALDLPALEAALSTIVGRHETMRSTYPSLEGRPVQRVLEPYAVRVPVLDLTGLPEAERPRRSREAVELIYRRNLPMDRLPLVVWVLVRLGDERHDLLHFEHHLVHDGWSYNAFLRELSTLYGPARAAAAPTPRQLSQLLEPLPVQVADLALWQQRWVESPAAQRQLEYWRGVLQPLPPSVELPADHPRPKAQSFRGHTLKRWLSADLSRSVRAFGQARGATVFMVLFAAYATLLRRLSGLDDLTVGSGVANRSRPESEGLIGMVLNSVVLRVSTAPDKETAGAPGFEALVARVRQVATAAWAHQDLPLDKVVEALQPERSASHNPFFQTLFSFHDAPMQALHLEGLEVDLEVALPNGSAKLDLNTTVILPREQRIGHGDGDERILFQWELNRDLLEPTTVERWVEAYERLLEGALERPEVPLTRLSLLSPTQHHQLLMEASAGLQAPEAADAIAAAAAGRRLEDALWDAARENAEATALVSGGGVEAKDAHRYTYAQLAAAVATLAASLQRRGVGPEHRVAVCLERSPELSAALWAVLAAGAAYIPLDPTYPRARLEYLLADAGVTWVLADRRTALLLAELEPVRAGEVTVEVVEPVETLAQGSAAMPPAARGGGDTAAAYMIHTSGSTGQPKGAVIPHRGIVNRLLWMARFLSLSADDVILQKTPTSFDVSVWELFLAPLAGARLAMAPPGAHRDPEALAKQIEAHGVTVIHFVPSMLREFLQAPNLELQARSLRHVVASGEALPPNVVATFRRRLPGVALHNLYGPTEASVDVTAWSCGEGAEGSKSTEVDAAASTVPIGYPVANVSTWVVDRDGELTLPGVPGELLLGGVQLARGYHGKARRTAMAFVPDPFSGEAGGRIYRTGDRVRRRDDGALLFLGRIDHQVKIRGFRIEVGEIETALAALPAVAAVAVTPTAAADALVAHWVPAPDMEAVASADELRGTLAARLPEHMVPEHFRAVAELPSTPSGKVDRKALIRAADGAGGGSGAQRPTFEAPATEVEELLAEIWAELVEVESVGRDDHFFRLGGHSLHATRLMYRLRELLEVELPVRALYETPVLRAMAQRIEDLLLAELGDDEADAGAVEAEEASDTITELVTEGRDAAETL